jgi:hypothetical protein
MPDLEAGGSGATKGSANATDNAKGVAVFADELDRDLGVLRVHPDLLGLIPAGLPIARFGIRGERPKKGQMLAVDMLSLPNTGHDRPEAADANEP